MGGLGYYMSHVCIFPARIYIAFYKGMFSSFPTCLSGHSLERCQFVDGEAEM